MSGVEKNKRDRVAKACATCRKKKIKCNGKTPCDHCLNLQIPCEYPTNKPRKSRTKALLEMILSRLDRLESLMYKIAESVGGGGLDSRNGISPSSGTRLHGDLMSTPTTASPALDVSDKEADDDLREDQADGYNRADSAAPLQSSNGDQSPEKKPRDTFFQQAKSILNKTIDEKSDGATKPHQILQYKGMHLGIVFMFGSQSIEWIKSRLKQEDHNIVTPFLTLIFYFNAWKQVFLSVWTDVKTYPKEDVKKFKEGIYPHDKQLTFELLRHYNCIALADFVCPVADVQALFMKYYGNKSAPRKKRYKFSYSEFMLMNLSLAISITVAIDEKSSGVTSPQIGECPRLDAMSIDQLTSLQEEMFLNSVFYFHTISVVSEGMVTIQALLLLATHLETTWVITDVNYTFVGMALRYAQEIGLHRYETFNHLPELEIHERSRLWAAVQCFDVEISHRTGKPPSVNMVDVSTLTPMDPWYVPALVSQSEVERLQQICGGQQLPWEEIYVHFYVYKLSQLRAFSYFQLFSATVKYDSLKGIQEIVTSLNHELGNFTNELRAEFRPRYYYEPEFRLLIERFTSEKKMNRVNDSILTLQLCYFYQVMTINKVPSQIEPELDTPPYENACYRRNFLDSARTILHLMRSVNRRTVPFFGVNWMIFYPFVATMNLLAHCLNHSDEGDSLDDLNLLIDVSMNCFNLYSKQAKQPATRLFYLRLQLFDVVVRIVLRITIKVFESRTNMDILSNNPALRSHLEDVEKEFPQFYQKINDTSDMMDLLNCMHPTSGVGLSTNKFSPNGSCDSASNASNPDLTPGYSNETFEGQSPRKNDPTLSNILHPVDFSGLRDNDRKDFSIDDDFLLAAVNQDYLTLPNFFFDNEL